MGNIDLAFLRNVVAKSQHTQTELAKMVGVKQPSLSKKLRDGDSWDILIILKVMRIVDAPLFKVFPSLAQMTPYCNPLTVADNKQAISQLIGMYGVEESLIDDENTQSAEIQS